MNFDSANYFKRFLQLVKVQAPEERKVFIESLKAELEFAPLKLKEKQILILAQLDSLKTPIKSEHVIIEEQKSNPTPKELILIENYNSYGSRVKEFFANNFKMLGFQICSLGEMRKYADYWYELEEAADHQNGHGLSDSFLLEEVKGTLNREYPNLSTLGNTTQLEEIISQLKSKYIQIFLSVSNYLLEYKDRIAFSVIWGGMLLESRAIRHAMQKQGIPCYAIEFSFDKDKFYFDRGGIIGNQHSYAKKLQLPDLNHYQQKKINDWIEKADHAKKEQPDNDNLYKFIQQDKTNILLLCQCGIDTVITYDSPIYNTTFAAYSDVFKVISKNYSHVNLVVKLHPGDLTENKKKIEELANQFELTAIVNDANPCNVYELMQACDYGITINSQSGLEMMSYGKNILCLGNSFYSNQGLGLSIKNFSNLNEAIQTLLNSATPNYNDVKKYLYYFLFEFLYSESDESTTKNRLKGELISNRYGYSQPKLLIVHPSGSTGGSGFYLQELAQNLVSLGWHVKVFCEGTTQQKINGVSWYRLKYDGFKTNQYLRNVVTSFDPDYILQVGVRTKSMRSALEAFYLSTNAKFLVQAEDDEESAFLKSYPNPDAKLVELLDTPNFNADNMKEFMSLVDWDYTLNVLTDPQYDRWVEPIMRILCYKIASAHCSIWYSMANRLKNKFNKPSFILPPIVDFSYYESLTLDIKTKQSLLQAYKIPSDSHVLFISGNIYDFSNEFETFVDGLILAAKSTKKPLTLLISGRTRNPEKLNYAKRKLQGVAYFRSLKIPNDELYNSFVLLADIICAPGHNDVFNEFRLPGRLVKAVAMKKPIMTFKVGFAEKLENLHHGFFSETDSAESWKKLILASLDKKLSQDCANLAYKDLKRELDSKEVAIRFNEFILRLAQEKQKTL